MFGRQLRTPILWSRLVPGKAHATGMRRSLDVANHFVGPILRRSGMRTELLYCRACDKFGNRRPASGLRRRCEAQKAGPGMRRRNDIGRLRYRRIRARRSACSRSTAIAIRMTPLSSSAKRASMSRLSRFKRNAASVSTGSHVSSGGRNSSTARQPMRDSSGRPRES
jgi:hypothetical protein